MKRGERFLRAVSLVTAAAAVLLLVSAALRGGSGVRRDEALQVTVEDSAQVTGYFIREERVLTAPFAYAAPLLAEGEKAAAGQVLALGTEDSAMAVRAEELAELRGQIRLLEQAAQMPPAALHGRIRALLRQLAPGPAGTLEEAALLKALILREGAEEAELRQLISDLRDQAAVLEASLAGTALTAPEAGWFSSQADGYEAVLTPERLETLKDPSLLPAAAVPERAWGRLILSGTWYLAAMLPEGPIPEPGDPVEVTLPDGEAFSMRVIRAEGESGLLLLSCGSGLQRISHLRTARCTLIFHRCDGLQIPAAALCTDETGQTFVYAAEGALARRKDVTVLRTGQDGCIVALEETGEDRLRPGDAVLTGNDLYDGKVVIP